MACPITVPLKTCRWLRFAFVAMVERPAPRAPAAWSPAFENDSNDPYVTTKKSPNATAAIPVSSTFANATAAPRPLPSAS